MVQMGAYIGRMERQTIGIRKDWQIMMGRSIRLWPASYKIIDDFTVPEIYIFSFGQINL